MHTYTCIPPIKEIKVKYLNTEKILLYKTMIKTFKPKLLANSSQLLSNDGPTSLEIDVNQRTNYIHTLLGDIVPGYSTLILQMEYGKSYEIMFTSDKPTRIRDTGTNVIASYLNKVIIPGILIENNHREECFILIDKTIENPFDW